MWTTTRIVTFAGGVVAAGGITGVNSAAVGLVILQLIHPTAASLVWLPWFGSLGFAAGLIIGLFAAVGAIVALFATRRRGALRASHRALTIGLSASAVSCAVSFLLFAHPYVINWGYLVIGTTFVVFIGVSMAVGFVERHACFNAPVSFTKSSTSHQI